MRTRWKTIDITQREKKDEEKKEVEDWNDMRK